MGKVWVTGTWQTGVWVDSSTGDPDYVPGAGATADSESPYYYYKQTLIKPVKPIVKSKPNLNLDQQFKLLLNKVKQREN
jgi:hypothetical protein